MPIKVLKPIHMHKDKTTKVFERFHMYKWSDSIADVHFSGRHVYIRLLPNRIAWIIA